MGLFGLIATLITGGAYTKDAIRDINHESKNREKAKRNHSLMYTDSHGHDRLTTSSEKVCYHGGKVYSLKHPNVILYDTKAEYYSRVNKEAIEYAKSQGKKYARLHYAKENDWNDTYYCTTELSTMKKYETGLFALGDWQYFKHYKEYNGYLQTVETQRISLEEYKELGGLVPQISASEYCEQKTKEAKDLKKIIGGMF